MIAILGVAVTACGDRPPTDRPPRHAPDARSASQPRRSPSPSVPDAIAAWKNGKPAPSANASRPFEPVGGVDPFLFGAKRSTVSASLRATATTNGERFAVLVDGEVACKDASAAAAFFASFTFAGSSGALRDGAIDTEGFGRFGAGGSARPRPIEGRAAAFTVSGDSGFIGRPGDAAVVGVSLETTCGDLADFAHFVIVVPLQGAVVLRAATPAEVRASRR